MNQLSNKLAPPFKQSKEVLDYLQYTALDGICYWETPDNKWISPKLWNILGYATNSEEVQLGKIVHPKDA